MWRVVVFRWSGMGSGTTVVTPNRISHSLAPAAMLKGGSTQSTLTPSLPGPVLTKTPFTIFYCLSKWTLLFLYFYIQQYVEYINSIRFHFHLRSNQTVNVFGALQRLYRCIKWEKLTNFSYSYLIYASTYIFHVRFILIWNRWKLNMNFCLWYCLYLFSTLNQLNSM